MANPLETHGSLRECLQALAQDGLAQTLVCLLYTSDAADE